MATLKKFVPPVEFHPGITLSDKLKEMGMSVKGVCCAHFKTGEDHLCRHWRQE